MPVKKPKADHKHLTLQDRQVIQTGIEKRSNKSDIARALAKDPSTIGKEIHLHRLLKPRNTFNSPFVCLHRNTCGGCAGRKCARFVEQGCKARDRSPGACNKCPKGSSCRLDKYYYDAKKAQERYERTLSESREGFNLREGERKLIGEKIAPLLEKGQSVYHILSSHKLEIQVSARTLYTYIEENLFEDFGVPSFSLKEKVGRRPRKTLKKRKDPRHFEGRRYKDYLAFCQENPDAPTAEMDTVYNRPQGPFIQTFLFCGTGLMIGFLYAERTSKSMAGTMDLLQARLGVELYSKLFPLLLTDRGSEFETYSLFETGTDGETRSRIFYCGPQQSQQKPHVENNHNYIRDILPNSMDLGFLTQELVSLMFSHINSAPRLAFNGRTPYEVFSFIYGAEALELLGIKAVPRDSVVLKPYLLTRQAESSRC
jgi:IS30 family transposase